MAGRPAVPAKIKELRGTARRDRMPEKELEHEKLGKYPGPPENLSAANRKRWYEILAAADNMGYLSVIALPQLERYVIVQEVFNDAWEKCHDKNGNLKTVLSKGGVHRKNPYYSIMLETSTEMRQIEVQWGWTPSSQSKVSSRKEEEDEYDEFDI